MAQKPMVAIEMFGMDDFLRQLRKAPAETRKAVSHGSREIAKTVLVRMKQRSRIVPHAAQYQTIIKSLKTPVGSVPKIKAGGTNPKAAVTARMIDGRKTRPASGDIFFGVEFGGGRRPTSRRKRGSGANGTKADGCYRNVRHGRLPSPAAESTG